MTDHTSEISPAERKRQLLQDQLQRAHRRLDELRREDFDSERSYREARVPRQRHVWELERQISELETEG